MPSPLPSTSRYLPAVFGGSHWFAQESFENIVIFGDSYSKLNDSQTWVDHLGRRLRKQNKEVEIHNFAFPGATAEEDLSKQLSRFFTVFPTKNSSSKTPPLDPDKTTFFIFLGINDCGSTDSDELEFVIETILDTVHDLYVKAGARKFIFVNVPPIDRSPQVVDSGSSDEIEERVKTWNDLLEAQMMEFGASSKEAAVLLFSLHQVLTEVLENPFTFDFSEDDPTTQGGGIWEDDLHLTIEVHDILAERLLASVF
ncbi:carbohydrate esterase family 16 protein [Scleroderma citrinum Foug A]|uniref:Carbohydrate esterase family 16 protein n=1 Tax=Scleroderma citrinum Foug A TaxID=1036808 RepID=A0A0C3E1W0_9AGAM|nr:carbohydrate esterase family 16 protein [Scleroderma citrinum Foug A]